MLGERQTAGILQAYLQQPQLLLFALQQAEKPLTHATEQPFAPALQLLAPPPPEVQAAGHAGPISRGRAELMVLSFIENSLVLVCAAGPQLRPVVARLVICSAVNGTFSP
jgi:hypothetical protein